jgi:hypothetical protein
MNTSGDLDDTFFRRMFIPIVITTMVLFAIIVIIFVPVGTPLGWPTFQFVHQGLFTGGFRKMK